MLSTVVGLEQAGIQHSVDLLDQAIYPCIFSELPDIHDTIYSKKCELCTVLS